MYYFYWNGVSFSGIFMKHSNFFRGECQKTVINVNEHRVLFGRNEHIEINPLPSLCPQKGHTYSNKLAAESCRFV